MKEKDYQDLCRSIKNQFGLSSQIFREVLSEVMEIWGLDGEVEALNVFWYLVNSRFFGGAEENF